MRLRNLAVSLAVLIGTVWTYIVASKAEDIKIYGKTGSMGVEGNIVTLKNSSTIISVEGDAVEYCIWRVEPEQNTQQTSGNIPPKETPVAKAVAVRPAAKKKDIPVAKAVPAKAVPVKKEIPVAKAIPVPAPDKKDIPVAKAVPLSPDSQDSDQPAQKAVPTAKPLDSNEAYQQYISAYNRLTELMSQGKGNTPEAQQAYQAYLETKKRYEAALSGSQ